MIDEKALEAAVTAYDIARCAVHHDKPMSDRNRQSITPMIGAAITAYLSAATCKESFQVQVGQSGVTDGVEWVVVPKEPTEAMMDAAVAVVEKPCFPQDIYCAMLAAAGGER